MWDALQPSSQQRRRGWGRDLGYVGAHDCDHVARGKQESLGLAARADVVLQDVKLSDSKPEYTRIEVALRARRQAPEGGSVMDGFVRVQGERGIPPGSVPAQVFLLAYAEYAKHHRQSAERLAERGGFSWSELVACLRGDYSPIGCQKASLDLESGKDPARAKEEVEPL